MAQYKYSRDDYYRLTNAPCIDVALALGMEINESLENERRTGTVHLPRGQQLV